MTAIASFASVSPGSGISGEPSPYRDLFDAQRRYFESGATLPVAGRKERLRALLATIRQHEGALLAALRNDLRKSDLEGYATEIGIVTAEIKHTLRHLDRWVRPTRSVPPLVLQPATAAVHAQPLGNNLIIAPWNYPINLALAPIVCAVAAGNVAILKPSELAPASAEVLVAIIEAVFPRDHVAAVLGGVEVSQALLALPFAHFFFTGSTRVGRLVARSAADHLARTTLELGGKSPAIVMPSADIATTARRIAWGKTVNAGQTCVAPDYVLVHRDVKAALIDGVRESWRAFYGDNPQTSPDYPRIVNDAHFRRVSALIDPKKVVIGGQTDAADRYIAPTVLDGVSHDDPVMQEEIFGPVLPIIAVASLEEAIETIKRYENPLALYLFTSSRTEETTVLERVSFGGGCLNATLTHLGDPDLPFGGVGASGQGAYHGKAGFDAFTHKKSFLRAATFVDPAIKYPPYAGRLPLVKRLMG